MVVTVLDAGLGNQMFQYAAGLALARMRGVEMRAYYAPATPHLLHEAFQLSTEIADESSFRRLFGSPGTIGRVGRKVQTFLPLSMRRFYENHGFNFDPSLFELSGTVAIRGYWQSFRYLEGLRQDLKTEYVPVLAFSPRAREIMKAIVSGPSIGIHVRRGDYLTAFPVLDNEYYARALATALRSTSQTGSVFVFTNDVDWCASHLLPDVEKTMVSGTSTQPHEELLLFSLCKNIIMANSTFSWWGAYLADEPEQIIAPRGWLFGQNPTFRQEDIYPETWKVVA
jgi:hypothetical protein